MKMKFSIVGNSAMAVECLKHMLKFSEVEVGFVIYSPSMEGEARLVSRLCDQKGIRSYGFEQINSPESVAIVRQYQPDIMLSINNFKIFKGELIGIPKKGIINFHNGPLPRYRGVNIPSWVIINGEKEHGVTWHFISDNIDAGDIVAQSYFPVGSRMTASELMIKCVMEGIRIFKGFFESLVNDQCERTEPKGMGSYYSLRDRPHNNGLIDFSWPYEKIDRMVRGLNH